MGAGPGSYWQLFITNFWLNGKWCSFQTLHGYRATLILYIFTFISFVWLCKIWWRHHIWKYHWSYAKISINSSCLNIALMKYVIENLLPIHFFYFFCVSLKILPKISSLGRNLAFRKNLCYLLDWEPFKMMKKDFYLVLRAFFVLEIFKFLSQHFGQVGEIAWLERYG